MLYFTTFSIDKLGQPLVNENPQLTDAWDIPAYPQNRWINASSKLNSVVCQFIGSEHKLHIWKLFSHVIYMFKLKSICCELRCGLLLKYPAYNWDFCWGVEMQILLCTNIINLPEMLQSYHQSFNQVVGTDGLEVEMKDKRYVVFLMKVHSFFIFSLTFFCCCVACSSITRWSLICSP